MNLYMYNSNSWMKIWRIFGEFSRCFFAILMEFNYVVDLRLFLFNFMLPFSVGKTTFSTYFNKKKNCRTKLDTKKSSKRQSISNYQILKCHTIELGANVEN